MQRQHYVQPMRDRRLEERMMFASAHSPHMSKTHSLCRECRRYVLHKDMAPYAADEAGHRCKKCNKEREDRIAAHAERIRFELPLAEEQELKRRQAAGRMGSYKMARIDLFLAEQGVSHEKE